MRRGAVVLLGCVTGLVLLAGSREARGQDRAPPSLATAVEETRREIGEARARLAARRDAITAERIELRARLESVEEEVRALREEWSRQAGRREEAGTTRGALRDRAARVDEAVAACRSLLVEVRRNAGAQLSLVDARAEAERLAGFDRLLSGAEGTERLPEGAEALLSFLAGHLEDACRIRTTPGRAVAPGGSEREGTFVRIGDVLSLFASDEHTGIVVLEHGSPRPHVFTDLEPAMKEGIARAARGEEAWVPVDVSGGSGLRQRRARPTLLEQFAAGGVVMWPILGIAVLGLLVGVWKSVQLLRIRADFDRPFGELAARLRGEEKGDPAEVVAAARAPLRRLLEAGVAGRDATRADLEEGLNEAILSEVPPLERRLSVLSVGAAVAPLLGLLGTVTGMIHTFRLISVFGTGDPRLLSAGISEALITTEAGLVVAIPLLLLHAFLSRRVQRLSEGLETSAISFLNRMRPGERAE